MEGFLLMDVYSYLRYIPYIEPSPFTTQVIILLCTTINLELPNYCQNNISYDGGLWLEPNYSALSLRIAEWGI